MLTTVTENIEVEMITHTHRTSMVEVVDMKMIIGATEIPMCTTTKKHRHTLLHGKAATVDLMVVEDHEVLIAVHDTMIHIIVGILMTGVDNPHTATHMCERCGRYPSKWSEEATVFKVLSHFVFT